MKGINLIEITPIGRFHTDFDEKFGIPRQSGLIPELKGKITFETKYRNPDAFRGIEEYSHLWVLWVFSENIRDGWSATVRPPRLGGNARKGVFATRAPFRPNPIGISLVQLERVDFDGPEGPVLYVAGADVLNGTPVVDIKPYLPYADFVEGARAGYASSAYAHQLRVEMAREWEEKLPEGKVEALKRVLALDPRPAYQNDPNRVYGMAFAGKNVSFKVIEDTVIVVNVE